MMSQERDEAIEPGRETCPLCRSACIGSYGADKRRRYLQCAECDLVFVPPADFLSEQKEKQRYDTHQNSPEDQHYRQFLSRTFLPLNERLSPGSRGLDFGSGPGPTLSVMLQEAGHQVAIYDRFYAPDLSVFQNEYDFITATEVVEHLRHPQEDLDRLWSCLKPGGTLAVMTKLVLNPEKFAAWHYKNDLTHICFFSQSTFRWLAARWHAELEFKDRDVIFLRKGRC
jgi:SAM-dependent methyltransferase